MKSAIMQTNEGQIKESYYFFWVRFSLSRARAYFYLNSIGRADYVLITDDEALAAFKNYPRRTHYSGP